MADRHLYTLWQLLKTVANRKCIRILTFNFSGHVTSFLLTSMFLISYIVIDQAIAEKLYSFHCQIGEYTYEVLLVFD